MTKFHERFDINIDIDEAFDGAVPTPEVELKGLCDGLI